MTEKELAELRLSVSKTKTFAQCKKQFEFNYILKLPKKDHDYHIFGKFCHKVLEDFHNAYVKNNSTQAYNIEMGIAFKSAMIEFKDGMTPTMKKDCWDIIDKYLRIINADKNNNSIVNVIEVEKTFSFPIGKNILLNGMIDRIQIDADNVVHVADYKTTKNKKYLKNDWFQLLTYAYVIISEDPTIEKVRASYILLRHDFEYITTEFSVPEILKIKDKYLDYAHQIRTEMEYTPNPTILCGWCDHLSICEAGLKQTRMSYGETSYE